MFYQGAWLVSTTVFSHLSLVIKIMSQMDFSRISLLEDRKDELMINYALDPAQLQGWRIELSMGLQVRLGASNAGEILIDVLKWAALSSNHHCQAECKTTTCHTLRRHNHHIIK